VVGGGGGGGTPPRGGAPLAGRLPVPAALLALLTALSFAAARPQPFAGTVFAPCPEAVLPLRLATFQAPRGEATDAAGAIARDEFAWSQPFVSLGPDASAITVAVLAYLGSLAHTMVLEVRAADGVVAWRSEIAVEPPDAGTTTLTYYPAYVLVDLPRSEWPSIFPTAGPYVLSARGPDTPVTYPDGFCRAEARSWLLVAR
jgi:hypothetical protein